MRLFSCARGKGGAQIQLVPGLDEKNPAAGGPATGSGSSLALHGAGPDQRSAQTL